MIWTRLISVLLLLCAVRPARGDSDPLLMIHTVHFGHEPFEYVWAVRQSRAVANAQYDPIAGELPVSPHQAIVIANSFIRTQFPASTQLRPITCSLLPMGHEKNPVVKEVWMYEVDFLAEPGPLQSDLCSVMVLMDGKVIIPFKRSWEGSSNQSMKPTAKP
jgi:hypothetical protein